MFLIFSNHRESKAKKCTVDTGNVQPCRSCFSFPKNLARCSTFAYESVANAVVNLANVGCHSDQNLQAEKAVNAANGVEEAWWLEFF